MTSKNSPVDGATAVFATAPKLKPEFYKPMQPSISDFLSQSSIGKASPRPDPVTNTTSKGTEEEFDPTNGDDDYDAIVCISPRHLNLKNKEDIQNTT